MVDANKCDPCEVLLETETGIEFKPVPFVETLLVGEFGPAVSVATVETCTKCIWPDLCSGNSAETYQCNKNEQFLLDLKVFISPYSSGFSVSPRLIDGVTAPFNLQK